MDRLEQVDRLADHKTLVDGGQVAGVEIRATAHDQRRPLAKLGRYPGEASVGEGLASELQGKPLVGLTTDSDRRNAIRERVEIREWPNPAAFFRVNLIATRCVGIVPNVDVPS